MFQKTQMSKKIKNKENRDNNNYLQIDGFCNFYFLNKLKIEGFFQSLIICEFVICF